MSSKVGAEMAKGKTKAPSKLNKLAPKKTPPTPSDPWAYPMPNPTEALVAAAAHPSLSSTHEAAYVGSLAVML